MKINSVLGLIDINDIGVTLTHEHICLYSPTLHLNFGDKWIDRNIIIKTAISQLIIAKEKYHLDTFVDGTPLDLGRDAELLKEVSEGSGVNIIMSTGMYYNESPIFEGLSTDFLVQLFINECNNGVRDTGIRPGILKCATDLAGITDINRMLLKTMAIVQRETQLPMYAHSCAKKKIGIEQLNIFEENGVDLSHVVIGHSTDSKDLGYLEELLNRGCYIGMDRIMGWYDDIERRIKLIYTLAERGWINKILLSHDKCTYVYFDTRWKNFGTIDGFEDDYYGFIFSGVVSELMKMGLTQEDIDVLMIQNPSRFLAGSSNCTAK